MGTNVYVIKKNPRRLVDWKKLEQAVSNQDPWTLQEELEGFREDMENNEVHLGKRSGGWKFLFDYQKWQYFDHTKESIDKFLHEVWQIRDEYGDTYTPEEFWKEFGEWNPKGMDGLDYYQRESYQNSISRSDAARHGYYMSTESPAGQISRDLPYYFSNDTDFS